MFRRAKGKTKFMYFPGDTARELRDGSLVTLSDSNTIIPCRNDTTDRPIGVARRNDTITDSAMVPVEVPVENAVEWEIDVDSDAGAVDSDIGRFCAIDTTGGASVDAGDSAATRVDISDTTIRQIFITGVISTTKILGTIARTAWNHGFASDTA